MNDIEEEVESFKRRRRGSCKAFHYSSQTPWGPSRSTSHYHRTPPLPISTQPPPPLPFSFTFQPLDLQVQKKKASSIMIQCCGAAATHLRMHAHAPHAHACMHVHLRIEAIQCHGSHPGEKRGFGRIPRSDGGPPGGSISCMGPAPELCTKSPKGRCLAPLTSSRI